MKRSLPFIAVALVLAACSDSSTEPVVAPNALSAPSHIVVSAAEASRMAAIGAELVDATESFLVVIQDAQAQADLRAAIKTLADRLIAGDLAGSVSALTAARERLAAVPGDAVVTELAPIALALDAVELSFPVVQ